jgi:hypothetical protein
MWGYLNIDKWGNGYFSGKRYKPNARRDRNEFRHGFFPIDQHASCNSWEHFQAVVSIIPIHLRPRER